MAITVKHTKVSTIPDAGDASLIEPSDWNADHQLVGTVPVANGGTGASTLTGYVKGTGTSAMTAATTIPSTDVTGLGTMSTQNSNNISVTGGSISGVTVSGYIPTSAEGVANGVATLDSGGQIPLSQIPPLGDLNYQGTWNATTNTPTLTSSTGTKGYYYVVSVAGTTNLNGITDWQVSDWAVFNGSVWQKIDNTDSVTSVNGYTGTVVLTQTDISGTVPTSRTITAGTGLSGGGDLSANRTLAIANTGVTATTYGSASSVPVVTVNAQGQITSATNTAIAIANTAVSGLGTMSTQNANAVVITGGTIDGTTIGGTTPAVITGSTINANTKVVSPDYYAQSILGGNLRTSGGTSLINWDGGGSGNVTVNGGLIVDPANKNINMSPTGTGSVTIAPATTGAMDNMVIGATTPKAITGTTIIATTFSGSGASLTSIPNSALVNSSITINGNATALGGSVSVGTVTSVTGTNPVVSSGGNTPAISMPAATTSVSGYLTSTDWNTFNGKQAAGTYVNSVSGTTGRITSTGGVTPVIDLASGVATAGTTGSSTLIPVVTIDTYGRVTSITTASNPQGTVTSVTGTAPVVSSGGATPAISMAAANTTTNGYLTSTDWNTFNGKGSGTVTSVGGTGTVNGLTLTGTVTSTGNLTLGGTLDLSSPPAIGGTAPNSVKGTVIQATNGIVVNSNTVSASYTIPSGSSAMSAGPMTVASGQSVTVSSGSRWVVL
jgi:hypothetical protein